MSSDSLKRLVELISSAGNIHELISRVAADGELLQNIRSFYQDGLTTPLADQERLRELCRSCHITPEDFEERIGFIARTLNLAPSEKDYYSVLGVDRQATCEEIKQAFRRLSFEHHPDLHPEDPQAGEVFKELLQAYEVLQNDTLREHYDRRISQPALKEEDPKEGPEPGWWSRRTPLYPLGLVTALLLILAFSLDFQPWLTDRSFSGSNLAPPSERLGNLNPISPPQNPQKDNGDSERVMNKERDIGLEEEAALEPAEKAAGNATALRARTKRIAKAEMTVKPEVKSETSTPEHVQERHQKADDTSLKQSGPVSGLPVEPMLEPEQALTGPTQDTPTEISLSLSGTTNVAREDLRRNQEPVRENSGILSDQKAEAESEEDKLYSLQSIQNQIEDFLKSFTRAYEHRDLASFMAFFESDALDNGQPIRKKKSKYQTDFERATDVSYRIMLRKWLIDENGVNVQGTFQLSATLDKTKPIKAEGDIQFDLIRCGDDFQVHRLDYKFRD